VTYTYESFQPSSLNLANQHASSSLSLHFVSASSLVTRFAIICTSIGLDGQCFTSPPTQYIAELSLSFKWSQAALFRALIWKKFSGKITKSVALSAPSFARNCWKRGGHVPFETVMWFAIYIHCDRCAICNHLAAICHWMSPTIKSTGVGHFGTKFWEEGV